MPPLSHVITIQKPYIYTKGNKIRLEAKIFKGTIETTIFYEFDEVYGRFLTDERSDPFLMAVMTWALVEGYDIVCECPTTSQLLYQLQQYYLLIMPKVLPQQFKKIKIISEIADEIEPIENGVGTACSGGIDSWYTITTHLNSQKDFSLTHLILANCGAFGHDERINSENLFGTACLHNQALAKQLHLNFIGINTNIIPFYYDLRKNGIDSDSYLGPDAFKTLSCIYAVKKLFRYYYFSSGFFVQDFKFDRLDPPHYDLLNLQIVSLNHLKFYSTGMEYTRLEKTQVISSNPLAMKHLQVCLDLVGNCGNCKKCIRTLTQLDVIGCIELAKDCFDIEKFEKSRTKFYGKVFSERTSDDFSKETLKYMKENKLKLPVASYFWSLYWKLKNILNHAYYSKPLRFLIYTLNLDMIIRGRKSPGRKYYGFK